MDQYKTKGRGRQGEGVVHDQYKHSFTQTMAPSRDGDANPVRADERGVGLGNRPAKIRRLQRLKRLRKVRGLSAKQLMERKKSQRATKQIKSERIVTATSDAQRLNHSMVRDASF